MGKIIFLLFVLTALTVICMAVVSPPESILDSVFDEATEIDNHVHPYVGGDASDIPDAAGSEDDDLSSSVRPPKNRHLEGENLHRRGVGGPKKELEGRVHKISDIGLGLGRDKSELTFGNGRPVYPPQCKCKAVPINRKKRSVCYDMYIPLQEYGRCKKRTCGRKYECVPRGGRGLKDCMRRIATHETKLRRDEKGVLLCNTYKLKEPKVFYTLYY